MGRSGCPSKKKNWGGGVSLQARKFELALSVEYHLHQKIESTCHLITDDVSEKKVLIAFRQILSKNLPEACIFRHSHDLFEKNSLELNSLILNSVQQDYLLEFYPIVPLNIYRKTWNPTLYKLHLWM